MKKKSNASSPGNRRLTGAAANPELSKATQFKPGESGNPEGRPKKRLLDEVLEELLLERDSKAALKIARALLKKAGSGDTKAIQLAAERTQGKPRQAIDLGNADDKPFEIVIRNVGPKLRPEPTGGDGPPAQAGTTQVVRRGKQ